MFTNLAFLAPAVTEAILKDQQRAGVTALTITATGAVDPSWATQRVSLLRG